MRDSRARYESTPDDYCQGDSSKHGERHGGLESFDTERQRLNAPWPPRGRHQHARSASSLLTLATRHLETMAAISGCPARCCVSLAAISRHPVAAGHSAHTGTGCGAGTGVVLAVCWIRRGGDRGAQRNDRNSSGRHQAGDCLCLHMAPGARARNFHRDGYCWLPRTKPLQ